MHEMQSAADAAPVVLRYFPGSHAVHVELLLAPSLSLNLPVVQLMQADIDGDVIVLTYLPFGHLAHNSDSAPLKWPALQTSHPVLLPMLWRYPAGQDLQKLWPSSD